MENKYHIGQTILWENEKLLVTSNFSFSHNIFHSYKSLVCPSAVLCGNGLIKIEWIVSEKMSNLKVSIIKGASIYPYTARRLVHGNLRSCCRTVVSEKRWKYLLNRCFGKRWGLHLQTFARMIDEWKPARRKEVKVNPFPHNDSFWRPWETRLWKTLWEKEKLLITSNFSFSHSVFYPFG